MVQPLNDRHVNAPINSQRHLNSMWMRAGALAALRHQEPVPPDRLENREEEQDLGCGDLR